MASGLKFKIPLCPWGLFEYWVLSQTRRLPSGAQCMCSSLQQRACRPVQWQPQLALRPAAAVRYDLRVVWLGEDPSLHHAAPILHHARLQVSRAVPGARLMAAVGRNGGVRRPQSLGEHGGAQPELLIKEAGDKELTLQTWSAKSVSMKFTEEFRTAIEAAVANWLVVKKSCQSLAVAKYSSQEQGVDEKLVRELAKQCVELQDEFVNLKSVAVAFNIAETDKSGGAKRAKRSSGTKQ